jgi:hypothetical protein
MLPLRYAKLTTTIKCRRQAYSNSANPLSQNPRYIPKRPGGHLNSPQAAFNPHTSTALTA